MLACRCLYVAQSMAGLKYSLTELLGCRCSDAETCVSLFKRQKSAVGKKLNTSQVLLNKHFYLFRNKMNYYNGNIKSDSLKTVILVNEITIVQEAQGKKKSLVGL